MRTTDSTSSTSYSCSKTLVFFCLYVNWTIIFIFFAPKGKKHFQIAQIIPQFNKTLVKRNAILKFQFNKGKEENHQILFHAFRERAHSTFTKSSNNIAVSCFNSISFNQKASIASSLDDFFDGDNKEVFNETFSEFLQLNENNIHVNSCFFHDISHNGDHGALYFNKNGNILIEYCTFIRCRSNEGIGAAINIQNANCVIHKTCGSKCLAYMASFSSVDNNNGNREKNTIVDSSISFCNAQLGYTVVSSFGIVYSNLLNLSFNTAQLGSGINFSPSKSSNSNDDNENQNQNCLDYCCFTNNNASLQVCVRIDLSNLGNGDSYYIYHTNFIDNQGTNTLFLNQDMLTVQYSSFSGNYKPVFRASSGAIFLRDCSVPNDQLIGSDGLFTNSIGSISFTNSLNIIGWNECKMVSLPTPTQNIAYLFLYVRKHNPFK